MDGWMDQIGRRTLAKDLAERDFGACIELTCKQILGFQPPNFERNAMVKAVKG